jgi:hypothetical protein
MGIVPFQELSEPAQTTYNMRGKYAQVSMGPDDMAYANVGGSSSQMILFDTEDYNTGLFVLDSGFIVIPPGISYVSVCGGILLDASDGKYSLQDISVFISYESPLGAPYTMAFTQVPVVASDEIDGMTPTSPIQSFIFISVSELVVPVQEDGEFAMYLFFYGTGASRTITIEQTYMQIMALG